MFFFNAHFVIIKVESKLIFFIFFLSCFVFGFGTRAPICTRVLILPKTLSNSMIKKSLYFTRNIIQNRFFLPNNLIFPKSRILLENYFN